jgi:hypothetical protein
VEAVNRENDACSIAECHGLFAGGTAPVKVPGLNRCAHT